MEQYYKNFILCGEIDYLCLLCKESFVETKDVDRHVRWERHRKIIKIQEKVPKFSKEGIFKIQEYFYCQFCNFLTKEPKDHVNDENHKDNKNKRKPTKQQSLVKFENNEIKINGVTYAKLQWHGISIPSDTCTVCNEHVEQTDVHLKSFTHMINLIQTKIKCDDNKCYRELPSDKFYCFTCNKTFDIDIIKRHLSAECDDRIIDSNNAKLELLASSFTSFEIDFENKTALCLQCQATVQASKGIMSKHQTYHSEEKDGVWLGWFYDHGQRRSELAKYGRANYIHLNERGCKGYCTLCDITISANINVAKQHVNGMLHKGFLEIKGLINSQKHVKPPYRLIPQSKFVKDTYGPFKIDEYTVMCFNDGICVDLLSFTLIMVIDDLKELKTKCFACDVKFDCNDAIHYKSEEHAKILSACKVLSITKDYEEFVREIQPGLYHCGYCNKVFPYWETMHKHLQTFKHKVQKGKRKVLSNICGKMLLNPLCPLQSMEEYELLRSMDGF